MGKRLITSFIGIPLVFWGAMFVLIMIQGSWDWIVGDRTILRSILLIGSTLGLLVLVIFSLISKKTAVKILEGQMGTR